MGDGEGEELQLYQYAVCIRCVSDCCTAEMGRAGDGEGELQLSYAPVLCSNRNGGSGLLPKKDSPPARLQHLWGPLAALKI